MRISGKTKLFAVIGSPIEHSGSPLIYNRAFEAGGKDFVYMAFEVTEEGTAGALDAVRALGVKGVNVTMPCKQAAARAVDELSKEAAAVGAVNTVVNKDGRLCGYMTDGAGYVRSLYANGVVVRGKKMTVLGAGGAGRAIIASCAFAGAASISVFCRPGANFERAESLAKQLSGCEIRVFDLRDAAALKSETERSEILANATSLGMKPNESLSPIDDIALFRPDLTVTDVVYEPEMTRFLREALAAGCRVIGGREMLLYQAREAYRLFTGEDMPESPTTLDEVRGRIDVCDEIIIDALAERMSLCAAAADIKGRDGLPVFQPEREARQREALSRRLEGEEHAEEIQDVFSHMVKKSRELQAEKLFPYNLYLTGFMGAGKTTVARRLGELLSLRVAETDEIVAEREGRSVSEIFAECGEAYFREEERRVLPELETQKGLVVSCGGGVPLSRENIDSMKRGGLVVFLETDIDTIRERIGDGNGRPLFDRDQAAELLSARTPFYRAAADLTVSTDGKTAEEICREIAARLPFPSPREWQKP